MKTFNRNFPLFVLFPAFLLGVTSLNALAQQPQQNDRKAQLKYCVGQLTVQVSQVAAMKGIKEEDNMTPEQKMAELGNILTPQQKEQLQKCMQ